VVTEMGRGGYRTHGHSSRNSHATTTQETVTKGEKTENFGAGVFER
jgi:hypothetical protein